MPAMKELALTVLLGQIFLLLMAWAERTELALTGLTEEILLTLMRLPQL